MASVPLSSLSNRVEEEETARLFPNKQNWTAAIYFAALLFFSSSMTIVWCEDK